ncbi:MAG TPA: hypothetical protein VKS60_08705, partial [Stellaceae bacterium]|nr:hypothetical protein [Stellaceae bacterium]
RRAALHRAAYETVKGSRFSIDAVAARYTEVFERIFRDIADGTWRRPEPCRPGSRTGNVIPPPHLQYAPDENRLSPDNVWRAAVRRGQAAVHRLRKRISRIASGQRNRGTAAASARGAKE